MQAKALIFGGAPQDIKTNNGSMVCDWMIGIVLAKILLARVWDPAFVCSRKVTSSTTESEFSNSRAIAKPAPSGILVARFLHQSSTSPKH
ncbi:hypothetical protein HDF15_004632 [Granulicella mallensis]|uniref:Uncharacterized protein n=1 Tax=Granulicella mallensis TaxID=940614 RepID=A0A7W8EC30_9BACT|nr:hypothetical protein [Granulicella mallensis]